MIFVISGRFSRFFKHISQLIIFSKNKQFFLYFTICNGLFWNIWWHFCDLPIDTFFFSKKNRSSTFQTFKTLYSHKFYLFNFSDLYFSFQILFRHGGPLSSGPIRTNTWQLAHSLSHLGWTYTPLLKAAFTYALYLVFLFKWSFPCYLIASFSFLVSCSWNNWKN